MKKVVKIEELVINLDDRCFFNKISLSFFEGISTFLCGTNGSGKTLLLKAITKKIKYQGEIKFLKKTVVVFDKYYFTTNSVEDELKFLSLSSFQKEFILNFFDEETLSLNPNSLSFYQQKLLLLCSCLYKNPQVVFIDNLYSFLEKRDIQKFNNYFKKNNITVILVSNDIEQALNYEYMIVMNQGMVAIEGRTEQVLKEEKILKRLGIGLPFYVDLSTQLQYYNLINKVYLTKEELVEKLWK